jgi:hypothetical protein
MKTEGEFMTGIVRKECYMIMCSNKIKIKNMLKCLICIPYEIKMFFSCNLCLITQK